jgi:hypothetical protein
MACQRDEGFVALRYWGSDDKHLYGANRFRSEMKATGGHGVRAVGRATPSLRRVNTA